MAVFGSVPPWEALAVSIILTTILFIVHKTQKRPFYILPPGPKALPIIGNILDLPPPDIPDFQHWLRHKDLYGPISCVSILGTNLIIIHDKQAAIEILERSSSKTSGRPTTLFGGKIAGFDHWLVLKGYTNTFKMHRRLVHQELGTETLVRRYDTVSETEVARQLVRTLREPSGWLDHIRTTAGATILNMTYGYTIDPRNPDQLIGLSEETVQAFSDACAPFTWLVDIIPAFRYLPNGFPGTAFRKYAERMKQSLQDMGHLPYRFVQRQMTLHSHRPSYVSRLIEHFQFEEGSTTGISPSNEDAIKWTASVMFAGGADTTVITMTAFTLAMIRFPEVQRKAQEEIDLIVGSRRLPNFGDRDKLPYINALVKECLRWWPVLPLGVVHQADDDVKYHNFCIPKGANLLPSIWWFLHDPAVYADPESFDPTRFLDPRNEPDPSSDVFGYGRRICPGRFFAKSSLYINIARSLAVFSFAKPTNEDGQEIDIGAMATPGVLNKPAEFKFQITPRNEQLVGLLEKLEEDGLFEDGDAAQLVD